MNKGYAVAAALGVASALLPTAALAQIPPGATVSGCMAAGTCDLGALGVGWMCAHQTLVAGALTLLLAKLGISTLNGILVKLGITKDSPVIGLAVPLIKAVAIDLDPPPPVLAQQAKEANAPAPKAS